MGTGLSPGAHESVHDVLRDADRAELEAGHAHDGFLSLAYGFLPRGSSLLSLPPSHRAWDECAAEVPNLLLTHTASRTIAALPELSADAAYLDDGALCRAALVLGVLAHAFVRDTERRQNHRGGFAEPQSDAAVERVPIPACVWRPWGEVSARLQRPARAFTFADCHLYNFRLRDPSGPRIVENMDLLVPMYGNESERIFSLTMTETVAVTVPTLASAAKIAEAVVAGDTRAVKVELIVIIDCLRKATFETLWKVRTNPHARDNVDPLVWSKTFAPFPSPAVDGEVGLSGGGAPTFHLLDALFGRTSFSSPIGKQVRGLIDWMPALPRRFIAAVGSAGLTSFVEASEDRELRGLYRSALDAYCGPRGWLGVHKTKVYGFMETGFRAGRTRTNAGFSGQASERSWETLDEELEQARHERAHVQGSVGCHVLGGRRLEPLRADGGRTVARVILSTDGAGLVYDVGDRLGVLPTNGRDAVARTVASLRATGDEPIELTHAWRVHLAAVVQGEPPDRIPLAEFLARATLRPVERRTAKALYELTRSPELGAVVEAREEDQWELPEIFGLVRDGIYDVRRLLRARPWEAESLARLVRPERFRVYSISSAPEAEAGSVQLTVGALTYAAPEGDPRRAERHGVGSHFLTRGEADADPIPVEVVRPTQFRLPSDPARPVVMFAGGTGIAPFRAFMQRRASLAECGANHLFFGTRDQASFYYRAEIEGWVRRGVLTAHVALSREDARFVSRARTFERVAATRGYLGALLEGEEYARMVWDLLKEPEEGGSGAAFYVCGSTAFVATVLSALEGVARRFASELGPGRERDPTRRLRRLVADGRLCQDIFTTYAPAAAPGVLGGRLYDASEVATHNDEAHGYWMIFQGSVYDLTEFVHLHPGGHHLLLMNAGLDATRTYERVEHHLHAEVQAMTDLYKIGRIRRLHLGDAWGIVLDPDGVRSLTLAGLFRRWVGLLHEVVGIENARRIALGLRLERLAAGHDPRQLSPLAASLLLEAHHEFAGSVIANLRRSFLWLWTGTVGLCDPATRISDFDDAFLSSDGDEASVRARREACALLEADCLSGEVLARLAELLDGFGESDLAILRDLKQVLRDGVRLFERHEHDTLARASSALVQSLQRAPAAFARHGNHGGPSVR
jgi:sulfite reductase alpha subunit-like flavoprotein